MIDVRLALPDRAGTGATLVAAVGFEDRATHLVDQLLSRDVPLKALEVLELETFAVPLAEDAARRWDSRLKFEQAADRRNIPLRVHQTDPYAWFETVNLFLDILDHHDRILFDLSGFTRLQVAALASALYIEDSRRGHMDLLRSVSYSKPLSYRHRPLSLNPPISYDDSLIAPLRPATVLRRSGFSRGVFLLGHEGERARIAFRDHPSAAGVVLLPYTQDLDEWTEVCEQQNQELLRTLRYSRMPDAGELELARMRDGWLEALVPADGGYQQYVTYVRAEKEAADDDGGAPVLLYLFGPKIGCFFASMAALEAEANCWVVYAVPSHYDVGSVDGSRGSVTFQVSGRPIGLLGSKTSRLVS